MAKRTVFDADGKTTRMIERPWGKRLALGFLILPFLYVAIMKLWIALHLLMVHNDTTFPEGANVYAFLTILQTGHLYSHPFNFPWNGEWYGPLYYLIGATTTWIFKGDIFITTVAFRALSLIAFAASLVILARMAFLLERLRFLSILVLIMGFGCIWAEGWTTSARPDMLSIFFFTCALMLSLDEHHTNLQPFLAGVLASVSFLCKQSTAPLFFALLICILLEKKPRKVALTAVGALPLSAIIMCFIWLRHEPIYENYSALGQVIKNWSTLPISILNLLRTNQIALIPLSIAALGMLLSIKSPRYRTPLLVTLAAWAFGLIGLVNAGAGTNYLILPYWLSLVFIPPALLWLEQSKGPFKVTYMVLGLLGILLAFHQRKIIFHDLPASLNTKPIHDWTMLSDISYLEINSRKPQLLDAFAYHEFQIKGLWKPWEVTQTVQAGGYDLIIFTGADSVDGKGFEVSGYRGISLWGDETLQSAIRNYRVLCEVGDAKAGVHHLILVPQGKENTVRASDIATVFNSPCYASDRTPQLAPGMH